jgi:hypothetical protein
MWNCLFLIFSASSMPPITTSAVQKLFSPGIGRSRCSSICWPDQHALRQLTIFL